MLRKQSITAEQDKTSERIVDSINSKYNWGGRYSSKLTSISKKEDVNCYKKETTIAKKTSDNYKKIYKEDSNSLLKEEIGEETEEIDQLKEIRDNVQRDIDEFKKMCD